MERFGSHPRMVGANRKWYVNRSIWKGKSAVKDKPWGTERVWGGLFSGKEITIKRGNRTSLKFNRNKNELLWLQVGKLFVECADEQHFEDHVKHPVRTYTLNSGEFLNVQAGCPYRLSALEDCVLFEISDTGVESRFVIDDDYGRETNTEGKFIFNRSDE